VHGRGGGDDVVQPDEFVTRLVDGGYVESSGEWVVWVGVDEDVTLRPWRRGDEEGTVVTT
jgi:hypothetical protein